MAARKKPKRYSTIKNDEEVLAIARIRRQLLRLEEPARERVIDWIANKFTAETAK